MLYKKCIYFAATLAACTVIVSCSSVKTNTAVTSNGEVIFFDDFNDTKLDRSKWNVVITGDHFNDEQQAYVDSAATIGIVHGADAQGAINGALELRPKYSPNFKTFDGKTFDFISGRLTTKGKFDFTYGTAEARIKLTTGRGLWPAWWMLGNGTWPQTGEIDIMEYVGETDWIGAAVHGPGYSGETPFVNRLYLSKNNDATQWHTYAVEWTPDSITFKYDGITMYQVTRPMVEHYGKWIFDDKQFLLLNFAVGGIYPVKVNGVKKPYYGLPEATLNMIKNNEAKMLVDWVRVTKYTGK